MKRRRVAIALVVLFGVAALAAWQLTHRHDPRLAGRWLVTESEPATSEQILAASDRTNFDPKTEWWLDGNGAGRMSRRQWAGSRIGMFGRQLQWWTDGDQLRIKWGMSPSGWESLKEGAEDLSRVLNGDRPQKPVHRLAYEFERPDLIRIQPSALPWDRSPDVLYLTRLAEDDR